LAVVYIVLDGLVWLPSVRWVSLLALRGRR
jgi:hypothetical protein